MLAVTQADLIAITKTCPHIQATMVDLPSVTPVTQRLMKEADATDRVRVMTADGVHGHLKGFFDVLVLRAFIQMLLPDS